MRAAASCKNQMKTWLSLVALTVVFCYLFLHESVLLFWTNVVKRNIEVSSIVDRISIIMTCQSCPITGKHIVECKVVVLCSRFNNESGNLANLTLAFLAKLFHFKDKKKCKKVLVRWAQPFRWIRLMLRQNTRQGKWGVAYEVCVLLLLYWSKYY